MLIEVFKSGEASLLVEGRVEVLCAVYAFAADEKRLLYVHRTELFPRAEYSESEWRLVAIGLEPPQNCRSQVRLKGFSETRID